MTTADKVSYNPLSFRTPFTFTDVKEWLDAFAKRISQEFPLADSVANLYSARGSNFDLEEADWYLFRIYATRGTNEGHWVTFDVEHRKSRERIVMITVKTFNGITEAAKIAAWMTCEMHE